MSRLYTKGCMCTVREPVAGFCLIVPQLGKPQSKVFFRQGASWCSDEFDTHILQYHNMCTRKQAVERDSQSEQLAEELQYQTSSSH